MSRRDRARGALLGAVLGDALGAPLEGASPAAAARMARRRAERPRHWGYTDDASTFIAVAESIRDAGTIAPVAVLEALAQRYEPARGFGRGMKLALRAFEGGTAWSEVARVAWPEGSRGNGGAVRAGAVALPRWRSTTDLLDAVALATRVTHAHREAIDAARLVARLVALLLDNPEIVASPIAALDRIAEDLGSLEMLDAVRRVVSDPALDIAEVLGTSPLATQSVSAAVAVFLRHPDDFADAVLQAMALGGDTDSIGAIVGCLAGATHGYDALPQAWVQAIAHESPTPAALVELADVLCGLPALAFAAADL